MSSINRTFHPKWVTYGGDGNGRDGYIVFANGGLNELRQYNGPSKERIFRSGMQPDSRPHAARKDATAFDYRPDGSGRDSYIIRNYGLKRNYRSSYRDYETSLRGGSCTPVMDARAKRNNSPTKQDLSMYNNWPSPTQRHREKQVAS